MFTINESEKEYRPGDGGLKCLMKDSKMNFVIVQFQPSQDFKAYYHNTMRENPFIPGGEINIVVNGTVHHLKQGDLIRIEPLKAHCCFNPYRQTVKVTSTLAPFQEADKMEVDDYKF